MAIEKRPWKSGKGFKFRVSYRNPLTKEIERRYFSAREHGTVQDAELAAKQFDLDIKRRIKKDPLSFSDEAPKKGATFKELAQAYYASKLTAREISESTVKNDLYRCNSVIFPKLGAIEAEKVTENDLAAIVREYRDRGCKQNSIRRAMNIIKAVYSWASQDKRIETNPAREFKCGGGKDKRSAPPTWEEFWKIYDNASPHIQRAMILSVAFGVRVGSSELLQLKKSETWLDEKLIRVWSAKKKQRIEFRDVDIMDWVLTYFNQWIEEDSKKGHDVDLWVHWRGLPIQSIKVAWGKTLKRAKITRTITPYSLRHLHATLALEKGADVGALAENMGTSPAMIRKHYQHITRKLRKEAMELLPDLTQRPQKGNDRGNKSTT